MVDHLYDDDGIDGPWERAMSRPVTDHPAPAVACPVCGAPTVIDRPDLAALDATCTACGWHTTSLAARARLGEDELDEDAVDDANDHHRAPEIDEEVVAEQARRERDGAS